MVYLTAALLPLTTLVPYDLDFTQVGLYVLALVVLAFIVRKW